MIDLSKKDADGKPFLEKYLLRKAFDTPENPYLPAEAGSAPYLAKSCMGNSTLYHIGRPG